MSKPMTVAELITFLQQFPPDLPVMVDDDGMIKECCWVKGPSGGTFDPDPYVFVG